MAQKTHYLFMILQLVLHILPDARSESFRDSPATQTALTHTPLDLNCFAPDPSPPPSVLWFVNNVSFTNDSRRTAYYDSATGLSSYRIEEVEYSDTGLYQCRALDEVGSILFQSDIGTLTVQGQPSFTRPLEPIVASAGSQAVFQCGIASNPQATVSWTYGTPPQDLSNGPRIFLNSSILVISNVQSSDEGFYHCVAQNSFGINSTSASLTIENHPRLTISPNGELLQRVESGDVTLNCEVEGGETVDTLDWFHNQILVTDQLSRESNRLALSLEDLTVEDGGEYRCTATYSSSIISQSIQLEILVPPAVHLGISDSAIVVVNHTLNTVPQCIASGIPPPTIQWLNPNGEPLGVENGSAVLGSHLTRSDSGVYECMATNTAGENRVQLTLIVEDSPLIYESPVDTMAVYGSDVLLPCSAEGPPSPTITWTRVDGASLGNSTVEINGALHLFSVAVEDSGVYRCMASNGYDPPDVVSATLTVLGLARVFSLTVSPTSPLLPGTTFTIHCTITDPPPVSFSIHWYQNGRLVRNGDPRILTQIGTSSGALTVVNPDSSYSGVYTCNITSANSFDVAHISVIVGAPPVITNVSSTIHLKPGQEGFINCAVNGLPRPQIDWFVINETGDREQLLLTTGDYYRVHTEGLEIFDVTRNESGAYECVTVNDLGRDVATTTVRVEGVPVALSISPTLLIANETYTLTCDIIYNFPMATVTWRRTDSTPLAAGRFTNTFRGTLEISPVEASDEGEYECIVSNEYGVSLTSQFITVHVRPQVSFTTSPFIAILHDTATITCLVEGRPIPDLVLSRTDGIPLSGTFDEESRSLTIERVVPSDMAYYNCTASNSVGVATGLLEVIVKGAPVNNVVAEGLNSTALSLSWSPPSFELSSSLRQYIVHYGVTSSPLPIELPPFPIGVTSLNITDLEEATEYQISVFGNYGNDVTGVVVTVTITTDEDRPSAPPQDVRAEGEVEALNISWTSPPLTDRNGNITNYHIFYRQSNQEDEDTIDTQPFSLAVHTPPHPPESDNQTHSTILRGLEGGKRYQIKISAVTSAGAGPNSTVVTAETLEPFPLLLILAIGVPAATILLLLSLLVSLCICYRCCYVRSRRGKHSPLTDNQCTNLTNTNQKRKGIDRAISAPVPGIAPNIDTAGGKFAMTTQQGQLLSTHPKVIMPEDVATPPPAGGEVRQVPHNQVLTSLKNNYEDPYEEVGVGGHFIPPPHPASNLPPPSATRSNPLYRPDGPEVWVNPEYNRLPQSDETLVQNSNSVDPIDYRDVPITLQDSSLPIIAHSNPPATENNADNLIERSQSLDMNVELPWVAMPTIREADAQLTSVEERDERDGVEEEEEEMEEERVEHREDREHNGGEVEEEEEEEEEDDEEYHGQRDGWEQHLLPPPGYPRTGNIVGHAELGTVEEEEEEEQEAEIEKRGVEVEEEEEDEEDEEEESGIGRKRRYTNEDWEERYVGEREPETPPLNQTQDELGASQNALNLTNQTVPVYQAEYDPSTLYAKIPDSYKAKKRMKMMKRIQKEERRARKQKQKMEEKEEKERRKARERERKDREKLRKRGMVRLEEDIGLGEMSPFHDPSAVADGGQAQAQFIEAATAALF